MMEHIINFDWNYREPEEYFIKPEDLDNSVTERILRNKFHDPLISSDEDEDHNRPVGKIDWDKVFSDSQQNEQRQQNYVPGLNHPKIKYLKLSALTAQQHQECLKVICAQNPHVLPMCFVPKPKKQDLQTFEAVKEIYENEQQEFIEWAKVLWTNDHCRRALRPKPRVETVYEAGFKMKAAELQSFPKTLYVAAQIPLETTNKDTFEIALQQDLITVNIDKLPEVACPIRITERLSIMKPCSTPEPCSIHPCKFILPTETRVTDKPLTKVHRSLAQFACDHGATSVAAESALRCLLERQRAWTLPVSVVDMFGADGEPCNVIVLGSEFSILKEAAPVRTYRAFRHMLDIALVQDTEMSKMRYSNIDALRVVRDGKRNSGVSFEDDMNVTQESDEDDDMMVIDTEDIIQESSPKEKKDKKLCKKNDGIGEVNNLNISQEGCMCKGTLFEYPPPRSYKKWRVRNKVGNTSIDVIVHCAHKLKVQGTINELILEPIPEYQLEVGASAQSDDRSRSLALALMLRKNAKLANVRVDGATGELVTFECSTAEQLRAQRDDLRSHLANVLHSTLGQLQGLLPGSYVLKHEPSHGANAILYAGGVKGAGAGELLSLELDCSRLLDADETRSVKTPPKLLPVLLPMHKHRRMLPLAFTYDQYSVAPEPRRPVTRQKTPPQALQLDESEGSASRRTKWRKKKGKIRKTNLS